MGTDIAAILDAKTYKPAASLEGAVRAMSAAFSPLGTRLIAGTNEREAIQWDVVTGKRIGTVRGHSRPVTAVAYSPKGDRFVTGASDGTLKVWATWSPDAASAIVSDVSLGVEKFNFSPDGQRINGMDTSGSAVWDTRTGSVVSHFNKSRPFTGKPPVVLFTPSGVRLLSVLVLQVGSPPKREQRLLLTDEAWREVGRADLRSNIQGEGWISPNHTRVATLHSDNTLRLWNTEDGTLLTTLPNVKSIKSAAFNHSSTLFAFTDEKNICVWDIRTNSITRRIDQKFGKEASIDAFTPDGRLVLRSYSFDRSVNVYDFERDKVEVVINGHSVAVTSSAVSPDGERLATADSDAVVKIWDRRTGTELLTLQASKLSTQKIAFSPDGRWLVAQNASILGRFDIWDATPMNTDAGRPQAAPRAMLPFDTTGNWLTYTVGGSRSEFQFEEKEVVKGDHKFQWQREGDQIRILFDNGVYESVTISASHPRLMGRNELDKLVEWYRKQPQTLFDFSGKWTTYYDNGRTFSFEVRGNVVLWGGQSLTWRHEGGQIKIIFPDGNYEAVNLAVTGTGELMPFRGRDSHGVKLEWVRER
ncbi:MAG: hypothetical protein C0467_31205 [Planctomycetaceae bacterium]|nr:hypothetical protein [Planctomycetaceae bacterium]